MPYIMERIVIAAYKPLPGKEKELIDFTRTHWQILHQENLVSFRKPILMEAADGTIIEVFGWKSKAAIEAAHTNAGVQSMWQKFAQVCTYVPIRSVAEAGNLFSEFTPLDF
jgi:hypothetical protein